MAGTRVENNANARRDEQHKMGVGDEQERRSGQGRVTKERDKGMEKGCGKGGGGGGMEANEGGDEQARGGGGGVGVGGGGGGGGGGTKESPRNLLGCRFRMFGCI